MIRKTITTTLLLVFASVCCVGDERKTHYSLDFSHIEKTARGEDFVEAHTPADCLASADGLVEAVKECYAISGELRFGKCRIEVTATSARVTDTSRDTKTPSAHLSNMMESVRCGEVVNNIGPNEDDVVTMFGRAIDRSISRGFHGNWEVHLLVVPIEAAQGLELGDIIGDHDRMLEIASAILKTIDHYEIKDACVQVNPNGGTQSGVHFQIWSFHKSQKLEKLKSIDPSSVVHFVKSQKLPHPLRHSDSPILRATAARPHPHIAKPESAPVDHLGFPIESQADRDSAIRWAEDWTAAASSSQDKSPASHSSRDSSPGDVVGWDRQSSDGSDSRSISRSSGRRLDRVQDVFPKSF